MYGVRGYLGQAVATQIANPGAREATATQLASSFQSRTGNPPDFVHVFQSGLLNLYASLHSEKWIEFVAEHLQSYSLVPKPRLAGKGSPAPFVALKRKSYSGDVSGTIGEMLFSALLRERFGVATPNILHLRSGKSLGPYPRVSPDFLIFDPPVALNLYLGIKSQSKFKKIVAEVKGSTLGISALGGRLSAAFKQLAASFAFDAPDAGIACVAIRDPTPSTMYDIFLVTVNP